MKTQLHNIYTQPRRPSQPSRESAEAEVVLPRLRPVTNDPEREFKLRPGAIRTLPDDVAALILFKKEWKPVGKNGIVLNGNEYYHENSITCATKVGLEKNQTFVLVAYNRHDPSIIHVLTDDGAYVESLPLKGYAPHFDPVASNKHLKSVRSAQQRVMDRMTDLHGKDTIDTILREAENLDKMKKCVSTFGCPVEKSETELPAENTARRIAAAEQRATQIPKRKRLAENYDDETDALLSKAMRKSQPLTTA